MTLPPGLRIFLALTALTIVATAAALELIIETPRRHPLSVHKGRRYE